MGEDPTSTKVTWVIKDVSLGSSYTFKTGVFQWDLFMFGGIVLKLKVADLRSLPCGWRKDTRFKIVLVNQIDKNRSIKQEGSHLFYSGSFSIAWKYLILRNHLYDASSGFILNDSLFLEAEVVCKDLSNMSQNIEQAKTSKCRTVKVKKEVVEESISLKKARVHEGLIEDLQIESEDPIVNVYGFDVRASEQEIVTLMLKKHPHVFSDFHFQNHRLRSTFMDELLKVIDILCRCPDLITEEDLHFTVTSLTDFKKAGLKVEWLDTKWKVVSNRKMKINEIRWQLGEKQGK